MEPLEQREFDDFLNNLNTIDSVQSEFHGFLVPSTSDAGHSLNLHFPFAPLPPVHSLTRGLEHQETLQLNHVQSQSIGLEDKDRRNRKGNHPDPSSNPSSPSSHSSSDSDTPRNFNMPRIDDKGEFALFDLWIYEPDWSMNQLMVVLDPYKEALLSMIHWKSESDKPSSKRY